MVVSRRSVTLAILAFLTGAGIVSGQVNLVTPTSESAATYQSVSQIITRAVARAKAQDESAVELEFESRLVLTTDALNSDGGVVSTHTELYKRYPLERFVYEELIQKDGQPLTEKETREETKKREQFLREIREKERMGKKHETDDERTIRFNNELMTRYKASIVGSEEIDGEPCWVLFFEPRPGKLSENSRMEKMLNRSVGHLYISQTDYGVVRIEFELDKPVKQLWGLIATLRHASGRLKFKRVEPGVWLPEMFDLRVDLRILFKTTRQHINRTWIERTRLNLAADLSYGQNKLAK